MLGELNVSGKQVIDHDGYTLLRVNPPGPGKIKVSSLLRGIEVWSSQ